MPDRPYTIAFHPELNLCDIHWTRLFTPAMADRYAADLTARFVTAGFQRGYRLRIDMSACLVQPGDAALAINTRLRDFPIASRIAIVVGSTIQRMQVRRFMAQPYLRIFDDRNESYRWLLTEQRDAA